MVATVGAKLRSKTASPAAAWKARIAVQQLQELRRPCTRVFLWRRLFHQLPGGVPWSLQKLGNTPPSRERLNVKRQKRRRT